MTVEELMKPRWKVTANYPFSPYEIGDIVKTSSAGSFFISITKTIVDGTPVDVEDYVSGPYLEKFPALFAPIPWYMDRDFDLVGMYVRFGELNAQHSVYKITGRLGNTDYWNMEGRNGETCFPLNESYPSTEQEYLTFINSKK